MNKIELTDYKTITQYKLTDYQLDELLNELFDELIIWRDNQSIYEVAVHSDEVGLVLDNHIPEDNYKKILDYCEKNFTDTPLRIERKIDWDRAPRKKGGEYIPLYGFYTTADDIERQKVEGGEIHWRKMMKSENS